MYDINEFLTNDIIAEGTVQERTDEDEVTIRGYISIDFDSIDDDIKSDITNECRDIMDLKDPKLCNITLNYEYDRFEQELTVNLQPAFYDAAREDSEPDSTLVDPYEVQMNNDSREILMGLIGIKEQSRFDILTGDAQSIRDRSEGTRPWIYETNENGFGRLKPTVIIADIMTVLDELKKHEILMNDEEMEKFCNSPDIENYYSYNNMGKIDTDFSIWYKEGSPLGLICLHMGRDARYGFSAFAAFYMPDYSNALEGFLEMNSTIQTVIIKDPYTGNEYSADVRVTMDSYEVYDESGNGIGEFTAIERDELISEINERFNELDCDRD